MIYKSEIFNNIKYNLVEDSVTSNSYEACKKCIFFNEKLGECSLKHNEDCLDYGRYTYWIISKSYLRKQKLDKINAKINM